MGMGVGMGMGTGVGWGMVLLLTPSFNAVGAGLGEWTVHKTIDDYLKVV